jgi:hypothetical protein
MPPTTKKSAAKSAPKKSAAKKTPKVSAEPTLALSDLHLRLAGLEKENEKLLKQIGKKRKEMDNFLAKTQEIGREVVTRSSSFLAQIEELDKEIHRGFEQLFTTRKMGKSTAKMIEEIYFELQASRMISINPKHRPRSFLEEILGLDPNWEQEVMEEEAEIFGEEGDNYYRRSESEAPSAAVNREESRKIRQVFLRLASVFHPDKVLDGSESEEYAEVMKEVNLAYQRGDLARLLEIEKKYEVGATIDLNSTDDLTIRCQQLDRENQLLKEQQTALNKEMRQVKASEPGQIIKQYEQLSKQGINPLDELIEEAQHNLDNITTLRDFVQSFIDRKITVAEFKRGPKVEEDYDYFDEDDFDIMESIFR